DVRLMLRRSTGRGRRGSVERFCYQPSVHFARVIVRGACRVTLRRPDRTDLLGPALIDGGQTPLGAAARGANRLLSNDRKNRVRVRRRKDTNGNPAAPVDSDVEGDVAQLPVGSNGLRRDRLSIDDELDRNLAGRADSRALDIPEGLLIGRPGMDLF